MAKRYRCRLMGWKCGYVMTAPTVTELIPRVEEHLRSAHNLAVVPQDIRLKVDSAVQEYTERRATGRSSSAAPALSTAPSPAGPATPAPSSPPT